MADLATTNQDELAPAESRAWYLHHRHKITLWGIGFVMPTIIFFVVFKYGPMLWAIELSFHSYDMVSAPRFVGLDNYRNLLADPIFRSTLYNTLIYIACSTSLLTVIGLMLALAINTGIPGARHCMTAMFLSNLMPIIAVCLVWRFLLHPYGVVNQLLQHVGFGRIDWLTSEWTAMPSIIMVTVWRFSPYFMVVFLAALLALPDDYYEAAEIDGAGPIRRFFHITLPLLMPTIFFVVVVSALLCARIFLYPYLITGGGPGNATRVLSMLIYETGFSYLKMGQAAAISVVLFAIMLVFTSLQIGLFARSERIYV